MIAWSKSKKSATIQLIGSTKWSCRLGFIQWGASAYFSLKSYQNTKILWRSDIGVQIFSKIRDRGGGLHTIVPVALTTLQCTQWL